MKHELFKIINHYGLRNQLKKLSEEVYELQEACLLDDGGLEALEHIIEEYVDVEILLRQIGEYFEIGEDDKIMWSVKKINRTLERIENEK